MGYYWYSSCMLPQITAKLSLGYELKFTILTSQHQSVNAELCGLGLGIRET